MAERTPDEIMADCLLKRGKMLAKTCPDCGSPLFDYKGEVYCVVCRERGEEKEIAKGGAGTQEKAVEKHTGVSAAAGPGEYGLLEDELESLIIEFCRRIREEKNTGECLALMQCIETGVCALKTLRSPVSPS